MCSSFKLAIILDFFKSLQFVAFASRAYGAMANWAILAVLVGRYAFFFQHLGHPVVDLGQGKGVWLWLSVSA